MRQIFSVCRPSSSAREQRSRRFPYSKTSVDSVVQLLGQIEQNLQSKMPSTSKFAFRKAKPKASTTTASDSSLLASEQVEGQGAPLPRDSYGIKLHKVLGRDLGGSSKAASFTGLQGCIVDLRGCSPSALYLLRLESCIIMAPDVAGSALIHNADRCVLLLGCHQVGNFRVKATRLNLDCSCVYTTAKPASSSCPAKWFRHARTAKALHSAMLSAAASTASRTASTRPQASSLHR